MGHITEAEEKKKKARKNRIRDRLILGETRKKKAKNIGRGTGLSLRLLPIILAGILEGTAVASKALHLNTRCTFKDCKKGNGSI